MQRTIATNGKYELRSVRNNMDMNYHLIDTELNIDYLLSTDDVADTEKDMYEYDSLCLWSDLVELSDDTVSSIIHEWSWRKVKHKPSISEMIEQRGMGYVIDVLNGMVKAS